MEQENCIPGVPFHNGKKQETKDTSITRVPFLRPDQKPEKEKPQEIAPERKILGNFKNEQRAQGLNDAFMETTNSTVYNSFSTVRVQGDDRRNDQQIQANNGSEGPGTYASEEDEATDFCTIIFPRPATGTPFPGNSRRREKSTSERNPLDLSFCEKRDVSVVLAPNFSSDPAPQQYPTLIMRRPDENRQNMPNRGSRRKTEAVQTESTTFMELNKFVAGPSHQDFLPPSTSADTLRAFNNGRRY